MFKIDIFVQELLFIFKNSNFYSRRHYDKIENYGTDIALADILFLLFFHLTL